MAEFTKNNNNLERDIFFANLEKATVTYGQPEYDKIYALHEAQWGIKSPACVLYRNFFKIHPHANLIPEYIQGEVFIAINRDAVPDPDFVKYLKIHEYWEHWIRVKDGFNLIKSDEADYAKPIIERERPAHRLAVLEEFKAAEKDGKLESYMEWWRSYYQKDIDRIMQMSDSQALIISQNYSKQGGGKDIITSFIKQNLQIREDIYSKLKNRRQKQTGVEIEL